MKYFSLLVILFASAAFGQSVQPQPKQCLVVAGNSGNNKAITYFALGVTGLFMSGDRYEYRDSANVPGKWLKPKYKSHDLQHAMEAGVHVVVVNKRNSDPANVAEALKGCEAN